jgi:hypothetical protein
MVPEPLFSSEIMTLSSSSSPVINTLSHVVSEKLTRDNFRLWKAQVWPTVRGAQFTDFLNGTKKAPAEFITVQKEDKTEEKVLNPEYMTWLTQDQQLISYLNSTLSKEVLGQVTSCETAEDVWTSVHGMYASQSRAHVMHLRTKLASTRKGEMAMAVYFTKMEYVDEMVTAGKKLDNDDVVSYILTCLDVDYNGVVENVSARIDPISISDLFAQLLAAEARFEGQHQAAMSANTTTRGDGSFRGRGC